MERLRKLYSDGTCLRLGHRARDSRRNLSRIAVLVRVHFDSAPHVFVCMVDEAFNQFARRGPCQNSVEIDYPAYRAGLVLEQAYGVERPWRYRARASSNCTSWPRQAIRPRSRKRENRRLTVSVVMPR